MWLKTVMFMVVVLVAGIAVFVSYGWFHWQSGTGQLRSGTANR